MVYSFNRLESRSWRIKDLRYTSGFINPRWTRLCTGRRSLLLLVRWSAGSKMLVPLLTSEDATPREKGFCLGMVVEPCPQHEARTRRLKIATKRNSRSDLSTSLHWRCMRDTHAKNQQVMICYDLTLHVTMLHPKSIRIESIVVVESFEPLVIATEYAFQKRKAERHQLRLSSHPTRRHNSWRMIFWKVASIWCLLISTHKFPIAIFGSFTRMLSHMQSHPSQKTAPVCAALAVKIWCPKPWRRQLPSSSSCTSP